MGPASSASATGLAVRVGAEMATIGPALDDRQPDQGAAAGRPSALPVIASVGGDGLLGFRPSWLLLVEQPDDLLAC